MHSLDVQSEWFFLVEQEIDDEGCTHCIGDRSGDGNTCHTHVENDDEDQVEYGIHNACHHQDIKWAACIAHTSEYRRTEIEYHEEGNAEKEDAEISNR